MSILIPRKELAEMISDALLQDPEECCGVMLGRGSSVSEVVKTKNINPEKVNRYTIDPRDMVNVQKYSDESKLEIVGFYHSHTYTQGYPSDTDVKNAVESSWTEFSYVIVSLVEKTRPVVRAFWIDNRGKVSEQIITTDGRVYRGPAG